MYLNCLFITTVSLAVVSSQDHWYLLHFSRNKEELSTCIGDHEPFKYTQNDQDLKEMSEIVEIVVDRFSSQTVSTEDLDIPRKLIDAYSQRQVRSESRPDDIMNWEEFREKLIEALIDCADNVTIGVKNNTQLIDLPRFIEEKNKYGELLDLILVNWPYPLVDMISTRERRSELRRYADDAIKIFEHAYLDTFMVGKTGLYNQ